jgi:hypothetical protein
MLVQQGHCYPISVIPCMIPSRTCRLPASSLRYGVGTSTGQQLVEKHCALYQALHHMYFLLGL